MFSGQWRPYRERERGENVNALMADANSATAAAAAAASWMSNRVDACGVDLGAKSTLELHASTCLLEEYCFRSTVSADRLPLTIISTFRT